MTEGSRFLDIPGQGQRHRAIGTHSIRCGTQVGTWAGDYSTRSGIVNSESYYLSSTFCVPETALSTFICTTDI